MRRVAGWLAAMLVTVLAAGCTGAPRTLPKTRAGAPLSYVALGGGEVLGDGTEDALRDAWPQVLFRTALPRSATFVNFASNGATVDDLANRQVPLASAVRPGLVTISLFDDLFDSTPVATFERTLQGAVHELRGDGMTRVLVANIGLFDQRPGYRACISPSATGAQCALSIPPPQPAALDARTDALNAAIARVARAEGVTLVDLHAAQAADRVAGREASHYTDAMTVNTEGAAATASVFAAALPRFP